MFLVKLREGVVLSEFGVFVIQRMLSAAGTTSRTAGTA